MTAYTIKQLANTPEKDAPPTIRLVTDVNPTLAFQKALEILELETNEAVNAVALVGIKTPDSLEKLFNIYATPFRGQTPENPRLLQTSLFSFSDLKSSEIPAVCSERFDEFCANEYLGSSEDVPLVRDWLEQTVNMFSALPEKLNDRDVKIRWLNAMLPPRSNPVFHGDLKDAHIDALSGEDPTYRIVLSQRRAGMLVVNQENSVVVKNINGYWNFHDYKPGEVELWQMPEGAPVIIRTARDKIPPTPHLSHFLKSKTEEFEIGNSVAPGFSSDRRVIQ